MELSFLNSERLTVNRFQTLLMKIPEDKIFLSWLLLILIMSPNIRKMNLLNIHVGLIQHPRLLNDLTSSYHKLCTKALLNPCAEVFVPNSNKQNF